MGGLSVKWIDWIDMYYGKFGKFCNFIMWFFSIGKNGVEDNWKKYCCCLVISFVL